MRFYIEVERQGPNGAVLVTFRDGPYPKVGDRLEDEAGDMWRVTGLHGAEVELASEHPRRAIPQGRALVMMAHAAA